MSNRKSRRTPASTTAPARKATAQAATKRAHGPRVVQLPSAKAKAAAAPKAATAKPVTPQIPAPGPHSIAGMRPPIDAKVSVPESPVNETPVVQLPDPQTVRVSLNRLAALLAIAPQKDNRHYLNGVYVHQVGGELRLVATDGHRMLVLSQDQPESLGWGEAGVILPAADLAQVLKYTGKAAEESLTVSFGTDHPHATIVQGAGTFQLRPVDGKFPDYQRVMDGVQISGEREPMGTAGMNAKYVKAAGAVSAALESEALFFFPGLDDKSATVFTFGGCAGAVLVVMPVKVENRPAISSQAVRLIGEKGMASTLAALKAHATRNRKAAKEAKAEEKARFEELAAGFEKRIAAIMAGLNPALPAPAEASKAAA